jgi:hypothetical protein
MIRDVHPGSRIRILIFYPSRIPDPGVKKAPDSESGSLTLDPNPALHSDAESDPAFHSDADSDSASQNDADSMRTVSATPLLCQCLLFNASVLYKCQY